MVKYTIYKTTCNVTGMYYIGQHVTENEYDSYLGSGIRLGKAINKYGAENFSKEILHVFDNKEEMNTMETILVNEELLKDPMCYNLALGGQGGERTLEQIQKISKSLTGHTQSEETKKKRAESNRGQKRSLEVKQRMSDAAKKRPPLTESAKEKMSESAKNRKTQAWTGKKRPTKQCPHCGKIGADYLMTRWHFDKCKSAM
jgi:group I intron endonuclease